MNIELLENQKATIAVVSGDNIAVTDVQSALDLAMTVKYETGAEKIAIDKKVICEDFFILSTGIAGEILQKFINYHVKAAIYGDFSHYTSRSRILFMNPTMETTSFLYLQRKKRYGNWSRQKGCVYEKVVCRRI